MYAVQQHMNKINQKLQDKFKQTFVPISRFNTQKESNGEPEDDSEKLDSTPRVPR